MRINFQTSNIVIVCYPASAGGKFLINCLGLSNDAVFQDSKLAEKQLNGEFSQEDKIQFLAARLTDASTNCRWTDLGLGCTELFGIPNQVTTDHYAETIQQSAAHLDVIDTLSNSDKKFFIVAHGLKMLDAHLGMWPNAKVIYFYNCQKFINFRAKKNAQKIWDSLKGSSWPELAPASLNAYKETTSLNIQNEIKARNCENALILAYKEDQLRTFINDAQDKYKHKVSDAIYWDTDNYFSDSDTITHLKSIYSNLQLGNFNELAIQQYYQHWIKTLTELKDK